MKFNVMAISVIIIVGLFSILSSRTIEALDFNLLSITYPGAYCLTHNQCASYERCEGLKCTNKCENDQLCRFPFRCIIINHKRYCDTRQIAVATPQFCYNNQQCANNKQCYASLCINPCQWHLSCGPNANCRVDNHMPICECPLGYEGNAYGSGCKKISLGTEIENKFCFSDENCPSYEKCIENKCDSACKEIKCGNDTICYTFNHVPVCDCLPGSTPNSDGTGCSERRINFSSDKSTSDYSIQSPEQLQIPKSSYGCTVDNDCKYNEMCTKGSCISSCNHCGPKATCNIKNHFGICECRSGYTGDPYGKGCEKPKSDVCYKNDDCRNDEVCSQNKCILSCETAPGCGLSHTLCIPSNHNHTCICTDGFIGDAYSSDGCK